MSMENALAQQKLEFLEMELEEVKRREENLKKINQSLMQAINNEPVLKDHTLSELQKANDQYITELSLLKKKHKEQVASLEKQVQEIFLAKKELQIDLKHQKAASESEKYELIAMIKQLESEKMALEKTLRKQDEDKYSHILTDKNKKDSGRYRQSFDKPFGDSRPLFNKENDALKGKIEVLMTKIKNKKEKIKRLKERSNEKSLRMRIEDMEEELETYKLICKKQGPKQSENEKALKKDLEDALITIEKLKKTNGANAEKMINELKGILVKKDVEIKDLKEKLSSCQAEVEKIKAEMSKSNLKMQQNEIYWAMSDEKRSEVEIALKNEIKFLIGKLLKAKSKISGVEVETVETKVNSSANMRSKSVKRQPVPTKMVSPLDLSLITRAESPFCFSKLDF